MLVSTDPDSDGEGDAASHYEAIYEAINELQQHGHHGKLTASHHFKTDPHNNATNLFHIL